MWIVFQFHYSKMHLVVNEWVRSEFVNNDYQLNTILHSFLLLHTLHLLPLSLFDKSRCFLIYLSITRTSTVAWSVSLWSDSIRCFGKVHTVQWGLVCSRDWQKPTCPAKRPSDLCFTLLAAATLHIFHLSLFSFNDSEVALALKEQSIICLACLINIGYTVMLTPRLGVLCCTAIWVRYIKQTTQLKRITLHL